MNLEKVVTVDDEDGNPQGFGPGEVELPDWAIERLEARGTSIESLEVPKKTPAKKAGAAQVAKDDSQASA